MAANYAYKSLSTSQRKMQNVLTSDRSIAPDVKKSIKGGGNPSDIKQFASIFVLHLARKTLLMETSFKFLVYLVAVCGGSLLFDVLPVPPTYFSNKENSLNIYFVKWGWGWTALLLSSFIYMTSHTYCYGNIDKIRKHLYRIAVGTVCWYFWVNIVFHKIENLTGSCSEEREKFKDKPSCVKNGYKWRGFDISGHTFLLVYCLLMISEEVKCFKEWDKISNIINDEENESRLLNENELAILKDSYDNLTLYIKINFVLLGVLMALWELMLFMTILYFHIMPHKVAGGLIAMLSWFLTYKVWYRSSMSPGLPGQHTKIKFQTYKSIFVR